jgi:hypothetical protein
MARVEYYEFIVTAIVELVNPSVQTVNVHVPPGIVQEVRIRMPPGSAGTLSWALGMAGVQVYPAPGQPMIVGDDEVFLYHPPSGLSSGAWQVLMLNLGAYQHSLFLTFQVAVSDGGVVGANVTPLNLTGTDVAG